MKAIYDYATNASCPQRPAWRISPVGYEWAHAVFGDCKQHHKCAINMGVEAWPKLDIILKKFFFKISQAVSASRQHNRKLLWMYVF